MIKKNLFVIYLVRLFVLALVPIIALSAIFFYFSTTGQKKFLIDTSTQSFDSLTQRYDNFFSNIFYDFNSLGRMSEVVMLLSKVNIYEDDNGTKAVQSKLQRLSAPYDREMILSAYLYISHLNMSVSRDAWYMQDSIAVNDSITAKVVTNLLSNKTLWVPQHNVTVGRLVKEGVSFIIPVPNTSPKPLGAVVVTLNVDKLLEMSKLGGDSGEQFIAINRNNRVVFGDLSDSEFEQIAKNVELGKNSGKNIYTQTFESDTHKKLLIAKPSSINEWTYIKIIPYSQTENMLKSLGNKVYVAFLLILLFGAWFAYFMSKCIYKPVLELEDAMKILGKPAVLTGEHIFPEMKSMLVDLHGENKVLTQFMTENRVLLQKSILLQILHGKAENYSSLDQSLAKLGVMFPNNQFCVMLFHLTLQEVEQKQEILQSLQQTINEQHVGYCILNGHNNIAAIVNINTTEKQEYWEELWDLANECNRMIRRMLNTSFTVAIGEIYEGLEKISLSYQKAMEALSYKHCYEKGAIILSSMVPTMRRNIFKHPFKEEELLFQIMEQGNTEEAIRVVERLFDEVKAQSCNFTEEYLIIIYSMLFNSFKRNSVLRSTVHWNEEEFQQTFEKILQEEQSIDSVKELFAGIVRDTIHQMHKRKDINVSLEKTIEYINSHYMNDITLDELATIAGLTPQYYSKVFKDYTQNTVVNYITDLRMEKSVELLNTTNFSIKEIAEQVGYRNPQYFIRVFKKKFRLSPMQYKRR